MMSPWEWFIPARDRELYRSEMMEGSHGGGGAPMTFGEIVFWSIFMVVLLIAFGFFAWFVLGWR